MNSRLIAMTVGLAALAASAAAQPGPPQPTEAAPPLETEETFAPPEEQVFISPAGEPFRAPAGAPYPVVAWFGRADADRDGALSLAEFVADASGFMDRLDTDRDGRVDGFENADYETGIAPEIRGLLRRPPPPRQAAPYWRPFTRSDLMWGRPPMLSPQPGRPPVGMNRQGAGQYGLLNEPHPVRGSDGDLDGRITRAEAEAAARRRFGLLDGDGDGRLVLAELPMTPAQRLFDGARPPGRRKP